MTDLFHDEGFRAKFKEFPLQEYYADWRGEKFAGNAPVNLLYFGEKTAKKIHEFNPKIKLIAILRNPVERAYSAYWFMVRQGVENKSFEAALKREQSILDHGNFGERCNLTYVSHGLYCEQLKQFFEFFNKNQLLILLYDDFKLDPKITLKTFYQFLGIKEYFPEEALNKKHNISTKPRIQMLHNLFFSDNPLRNLYQRIFSERSRYILRTRFTGKLININQIPSQYPPINSSTKEKLIEAFKNPNEKLERIIQRDLSHWNI